MGPRPHTLEARHALAIDLELTHGPNGAAARIEFRDASDGTLALVHVRGWIEGVALARLQDILAELARRGVARLVLDCSQLRHIDYRQVGALIESLARLESPTLAYGWCGLSRHLRDLFRLAGCDPALHDLASTDHWAAAPVGIEPSREWAS